MTSFDWFFFGFFAGGFTLAILLSSIKLINKKGASNMKTLAVFTAMILFSQPAFAAWTSQRVSTRQDADTLTVTVRYTNGTDTVTEDVPVFQPQTIAQVRTAIVNRGLTIKERLIARDRISSNIKPAVDSSNANGQVD